MHCRHRLIHSWQFIQIKSNQIQSKIKSNPDPKSNPTAHDHSLRAKTIPCPIRPCTSKVPSPAAAATQYLKKKERKTMSMSHSRTSSFNSAAGDKSAGAAATGLYQPGPAAAPYSPSRVKHSRLGTAETASDVSGMLRKYKLVILGEQSSMLAQMECQKWMM